MKLIREAEELEVAVGGEVNGTAFDDFRDLDDLLGPTLEVYTATGKYYWIGIDQVVSLEFSTVGHLTDMLWRSASIETTGEVMGRVHIPALYQRSAKSEDQRVRIGKATEWSDPSGDAPVLGSGQREFLAGDEAIPIMEIQRLSFRGTGSVTT